MSKFTVFANGRSVAGKATHHMAWATAPDVCKLPNNVPTPFPNWVMSTKIAAGQTTHTTILKKPIWTKPTEAGPPSEPAHPGVNKGVKSSTYRGEAKAISVSQNVIVEGKGVARMLDTTTQNHENTIGIITDAALLDQLLKDWYAKYGAKEDPGKGAKGKGPDGHEPPKAPKTEEKKPDKDGKDKGGKETEAKEDCLLQKIEVTCSHEERKARPDKGGTLEVVTDVVGDKITLKADVEGKLCAKHVEWAINDELKVGNPSSFRARAIPIPGSTIKEMMTLQATAPKPYKISARCCKGEKQDCTVLAWPGDVHKIAIDFKPLKAITEKVAEFLAKWVKLPAKDFECLSGAVSISAQWYECDKTSPKVCFLLEAEGGFNPLLAITGHFNLLEYLGPVGRIIALARKLWIKIELYLEPKVEFSLTVKGNRHFGCGKGEIKIGMGGTGSISLGVRAGLEKDQVQDAKDAVVSADAAASASMGAEVWFKVGVSRPVRLALDTEGKIGVLKGTVKVTVAFGRWLPKWATPKWLADLDCSPSWEVTFWEGCGLWSKKDVQVLP
jgi:hypothetical protein